jgi:anti-anti-sigma regulatory factor
MNTKTFIITLPAEYTQSSISELAAEVSRFEQSGARHVGIDLSHHVILRSEQLGCLARAMKSAEKRDGKTMILVKNDSLLKLLQSIHFDKKACIFQDNDDFNNEIVRLESEKPKEPKTQETVYGKEKVQTTEVGGEKSFAEYLMIFLGKRKVQLVLLIAALCSITLNIFLIITISMQFSSIKKLKTEQTKQAVLLQQKMDEVVKSVNSQREEQMIMQELENAADAKQLKNGKEARWLKK